MSRAEMTVELYVTLDGTDNRFDGCRAHKHLTQSLAMNLITMHVINVITFRWKPLVRLLTFLATRNS